MSTHTFKKITSLFALALIATAGFAGHAMAARNQPEPKTIYYVMDPQDHTIFWQITQPNPSTGGVTGEGNGFLAPFTNPCATLRDSDHFYVLDSLTSASNSVTLYVYRETATGVVAEKTVNLPATGDINATCSLGVNSNYIYASTNTSNVFVTNRATYMTAAAATYINGPATSIISNPNFVAVNQMSISPAGPLSTIFNASNISVGGAGGLTVAVGTPGGE